MLYEVITFSYGQDDDSNESDVYRVGLQNNWERSWFTDGAWYVGGYWDAELAYMESDVSDAENSELFDLSLTPVFRMQRDTGLSSGVSPYAEAGVGAHLRITSYNVCYTKLLRAVPCMGALIAVRSAAARRCPLRELISGRYRRLV